MHRTSNYGTSTKLWAQVDDPVSGDIYTLLKFNLNQNFQVLNDPVTYNPCTLGTTDGTIYLKVSDVSNGGHELYSLSNNWTETGVKYNDVFSSLTIGQTLLDTTVSTEEDSVNDWTTLAVPGSVLNDACTNNSGIVSFIVSGGSTNAIAWHSRDDTVDRPYIVVTVND